MEHSDQALQSIFCSEYPICVGPAGSYGVFGRSGVWFVNIYPSNVKMLVSYEKQESRCLLYVFVVLQRHLVLHFPKM